MKVNELMTQEPRTCTPDTSVAEAAHLMWEADCGILPVVDDGELVGVVTDRDMYIALATQDARAAHLRVGAVATKKVVTCVPEDDVETALAAMRDARVRRPRSLIRQHCGWPAVDERYCARLGFR